MNQKSEKNIHAFDLNYYQEITGNNCNSYQGRIQLLKEVSQEMFHLSCTREAEAATGDIL